MFRKNPWIIFILSYVILILIGAFLLFLPFSHYGKISFTDAVFTATSAVSVTGLTVLDTRKDFTRTGQIIILILIQIGGVGIMTFVIATAILLRRKLGIGIKEIMSEEYVGKLDDPRKIIKRVLIYTFSIEFFGFLFILLSLRGSNVESKVFTAIFHSISAFCNAGFSTFSEGLTGFKNNYWLLLSFSILIFLGGIGLITGEEIFERLIKRNKHLSLNAKISLSGSGILITIGTIFIFIGEIKRWNAGIFSLLINSFFQAVTPRTAGFNSMKISEISGLSAFIIWILMIIGTSSGSCGGGMKVNTIGTIFSYIKGRLSGFKDASIFGRTIGNGIVEKAISIFAFYITVLLSGTLLLLWIESENLAGTSIFPVIFEATSALGTVGLSFGITPNLSTGGKIVIILLMLIGKIGIYSFIFGFLMRKREEKHYTFPKEDILVG